MQTNHGRARWGALVAGVLLVAALLLARVPGSAAAGGAYRLFLPLVRGGEQVALDCGIEGASYGQLSVNDWHPPDRPAEEHADLNLALRGYAPSAGLLGLVNYNGGRDPAAPQLYGLFVDQRTPVFSRVYSVFRWDWTCNCRADQLEPPYGEWDVTLAGMAVTRGEAIHVPNRQGGELDVRGYKVLVLYAAPERITLKYTRDDSVVSGYTLHIEQVCVDPALLALYRTLDNQGRHALPALHPGQAVGRALSGEVGVAIRDVGYWMDPRSRKDWWFGR